MKGLFCRVRFSKLLFVGETLLFFLFVNGGCCRSSAPDISGVEVTFKLDPFYERLFSIPPDSVTYFLEDLKEDYGSYLDAYSQGVIRVGSPDDSSYAQRLSRFLAYQPNADVLDSCRRVFKDTASLKRRLTKAFRYYHYYFPLRTIPDVYLHISGFNQSVVIDSAWVSVSVEKYLGADNPFYEWLQVPVYLRQQMTPARVVPDVVQAIGLTEFPFNDSIDDVVSHMVYQGQVLQFMKHVMPDIPDSLLFGYSSAGMKWCHQHESVVWKTMVEKKHLFATDAMIVRKYIGEAPFTPFFGQESPGRLGRFMGYQLLDSWLKRHPEKTIVDLMALTDSHKVLAEAGYRP